VIVEQRETGPLRDLLSNSQLARSGRSVDEQHVHAAALAVLAPAEQLRLNVQF